MSRKVIEYQIDDAIETASESQYRKHFIRVNIKNKHFILMEYDVECGIPNCDGKKCHPDKTQIAKIRKFHRGNNFLKRKMKEEVLNEMPAKGRKRGERSVEYVHQEGEFDDDEDGIEEEMANFLKIQLEEQDRIKNRELLEKRQRYIRLMNMYVKILDHYSKWLNENEVKRITEALYFDRCEDYSARQLERMESRAINIIR